MHPFYSKRTVDNIVYEEDVICKKQETLTKKTHLSNIICL